jgi:hypothetical protein
MFAPPPRVRSFLAYSLKYSSGWTELRRIFEERLALPDDSFFVPHGVDRLRCFMSVLSTDLKLKTSPARQQYFQGIAHVLCGKLYDGQRPALARIYIVRQGVERFYPEPDGRPTPTVEEQSGQLAIYELDCPP